MPTALRILLDVLAYRLRRLEMANLAGGVSVMLALIAAVAYLWLGAADERAGPHI